MNNMLTHAAATPPEDSTTRLIPLTRGKFAVVDAADFEWLNQWKWNAQYDKKLDYYRASRKTSKKLGKSVTVYMHRLIVNAPIGTQVDHRDGDGLNNRRSNLRSATHFTNGYNRGPNKNNTSGFKGVARHSGKWWAYIGVNGKRINLGRFFDIHDAAAAYAAAARKYHGEFARTEPFDRNALMARLSKAGIP